MSRARFSYLWRMNALFPSNRKRLLWGISGTFIGWILLTNFLAPRAVGQDTFENSSPATSQAPSAQLRPNPPPPPAPLLTPQRLDSILGTPSEPRFDLYRLGPGDAIFVSVQRFPDLSFQATLDIQGNVIVPIEGAVSLEGLTLQEAQEKIRQMYNRYVVDPDVTLTLTAQRPVQVTVLGEVQRPGFYPLPAPQVSTALLSAGGSTNLADLRAISVQRRLRNGDIIEEAIDLFTPLKEGEALPDLRLENGDVLFVPRLDVSALDEYDRYLVSRSTIAQQQISIRVLNYSSGGERRGGGGNISNIIAPNGSRFLDVIGQLQLDPGRARLGDIALIRFDPESGKAITTSIDARKALRGDISQNPPLEDRDVVVVGRNLIARITFALNQFTLPFRDILGFVLFFDSIGDAANDLFRP
ncbi:MAG: polysaccharide biosynthesis/export family protein [Pseudanabaenales cyanobacterium]|nr:polysaccharide biosynthesis/export family protein [Pseudanabaenales cyanobacterium]